ncbi:MAG: AMP-binding protein [Verrucomicrobiales bacterium]|nr:AMP-binding protein [Verrucomicrobiales bacterium]
MPYSYQVPAEEVNNRCLLSGIPETLCDLIERVGIETPQGERLPFEEAETFRSIGERFDYVAGQVPENIAISFEGDAVTYRELREFVDTFCRSFETLTVDRHSPVALCGRTGVSMIAAMLACFKLGRPYVFIHPDLPPARVNHVISDTDCSILAYGPEYPFVPEVFRIPHGQGGAKVFSLPAWGSRAFEERDVRCSATAQSLAYIIYTSGSTGVPKGVAQSHGNVLADIQRQSRDLMVTQEDRYGLIFPLSSSAAICHLGGALLNGATLCPLDMSRSNLHDLIDWLNSESITIFDINVSTFRQLGDLLEHGKQFPRLRILAPGSEPVHRIDYELYVKYFSDNCVFQNAFGTSETRTVTHSYTHKSLPPAFDEERVTIGFPVDGKEVLVLNDEGAEVVEGAPGEMVIRSRTIAKEYWQRPELSEDRFYPDPDDGEFTCYRTRDLVKRGESGLLFHLGRIDQCHKIRGFLVDFSEIESVLRSAPGVCDAVVVPFQDPTGTERIAAFVLVKHGDSVEVGALQVFLSERLPGYMVPQQLQVLPEFPYLLNQKLDRVALQEMIKPGDALSTHSEGASSSSPFLHTSEWERKIAQLWSKILERDDLDLEDDFVAVGGDSLMALSLFAEIEKNHGVSFTAIDVFEAFTIASMAARAEGRACEVEPEEAENRYLVRLCGERNREPLLFVPGGWGGDTEILVFAAIARRMPDNLDIRAIRSGAMELSGVRPDFTKRTLRAHVSEVLREVELSMVTDEGFTLVGECVAAVAAMELALQMEEAGIPLRRVILLDPERPSPLGSVFSSAVEESPGDLPSSVSEYYALLRASPVPRIGCDIHLVSSAEFPLNRRTISFWRRRTKATLFHRKVAGTHSSYIREESTELVKWLRSLV